MMQELLDQIAELAEYDPDGVEDRQELYDKLDEIKALVRKIILDSN